MGAEDRIVQRPSAEGRMWGATNGSPTRLSRAGAGPDRIEEHAPQEPTQTLGRAIGDDQQIRLGAAALVKADRADAEERLARVHETSSANHVAPTRVEVDQPSRLEVGRVCSGLLQEIAERGDIAGPGEPEADAGTVAERVDVARKKAGFERRSHFLHRSSFAAGLGRDVVNQLERVCGTSRSRSQRRDHR